MLEVGSAGPCSISHRAALPHRAQIWHGGESVRYCCMSNLRARLRLACLPMRPPFRGLPWLARHQEDPESGTANTVLPPQELGPVQPPVIPHYKWILLLVFSHHVIMAAAKGVGRLRNCTPPPGLTNSNWRKWIYQIVITWIKNI
jgi:hypothetical protein